jgi:hypothetical protein
MQRLLRNHSYFGTGDVFAPGRLLDKLLHPYRHSRQCLYQGKPFTLRWTHRADQAMQALHQPMLIEMQLYFSCVIKKRVLFHQDRKDFDGEPLGVYEHLAIVMRSVQSDRCDPVEFARNYPASRVLDAPATKHMRARQLDIDFRQGQWHGEFLI